MNLNKTIFTLLIFSSCLVAHAQDDKKGAEHKWVLYGGVGPNYYFNNLVRANDKVNELNYSFVARLMWEPEYRLSIGFETGYYRLYSLTGTNPSTGDVRINNASIPIQVVVSMKFFDNFYGNFNMGHAILLNNVTTSAQGDFSASTFSLGDFTLTAGYRKLWKERLYIGAEIKGYYSTKLDDKNIAFVFMTGYKLW
jgi:Outer membrane protein beta-barrel domain